ncbi:hypothetical protein YYC_01134 [Plasmodium yoelii 17X]|uniref:Uncharacterized protein n=1 Tax=Plasmodium yoelii 17X TaxID=1323249 RepID=V7PQF2_PLAYE|nr:hypothetical protein YYC_01134 [Plasmodium yoelii 17X]
MEKMGKYIIKLPNKLSDSLKWIMNLSIFIKNNINLCNLDRKWNNATYFVNVIILEKTVLYITRNKFKGINLFIKA